MTEALVAIVTAVLSIIVSVLLEVVPEFSSWWGNWPYKRLAWLVGCFVVAFAVLGLAYAGAPIGFTPPGPFLWDGLILAIQAGFAAFFAGQVTYAVVGKQRRDLNRSYTLGRR